ncbi:MAG: hypothetical protein WDZ31_05375 [Phycisphaeraceae bacterium]
MSDVDVNDKAVHLEQVEIHRVLGIGRGQGWLLRDLSPGVNVIHGPNGCGKSTTARVVQELLWPGRTRLDRPTVTGRFRHAGQPWRIEIDAGDAACTCDGQPQAGPSFGPPELRRRYWLALDDLIKEDDQAFAKAIADASQGGFDLDAAAAELGYRDRPRARTTERRAVDDALAAVTEAQRRQQAVDDEAQQLTELIAEREKARVAAGNLALLERARACHAAREQCRSLEQQLAALPEGVARLLGNERETLDALTARHAQHEQKRRDAARRLADAAQTLDEAGLPETGIDPDLLRALHAKARRLATLETELRQRQQEAANARAQADRTRQRLTVDPPSAATLDGIELDDVMRLARKADRLRGQQQTLAERRRTLEQAEPAEVQGLSETQLREGMTALAHWLATPAATAKHRRQMWGLATLAGVAVVLAVLLAALVHWTWVVAALVGPAVALLAWPRTHGDDRNAHQRSFQRTELPEPAAWDAQTVSAYVHRLAGLLAQRRLADARATRLAEVAHEQTQLEHEQTALAEQRDALQQKLGVSLSLEDEWLPLLVENLVAWQHQSAAADGAEAAIATLAREADELAKAINAALAEHGYASADDAETATQAIDDLAARQQRRATARQESTAAQRDVTEAELAIETARAERRKLLDRVGLSEQDEPTLDTWLELRPQHQQLQSELTRAQWERDREAEALADRPHLLEMDLATLQREIESQRTLAERRETLSEQIATIQSHMQAAKEGHELGEALQQRDAAADALARAREANRAAMVGATLTDWVRQEAVQRSRPEVFRRADELLVRITRGALQLEVDDRDGSPSFRARVGGKAVRPVTELSLGERVQMLMAVRLAFMEQDESARLPLILDELLGTTDDGRAAAVIDAVIACARDGRQVFCFTAQHDEAGKWIARLKEAEVEHRVIDLAHVRGRSVATARPLELASVERLEPPPPGDASWQQYGQALHVPAIDPMQPTADDLHLWHVVHDPQKLHELLCMGITTWGQLRVVLAHGGAGLLRHGNGTLKTAPAAAAAIEAVCAAWRIGRGRPVDRAVLQDAGCVSETFIDEVTALAKSLQGDAAALLAALEAGEVKRWRKQNTEQLRDYFLDHGYLSEEPPLEPDALRARATGAVSEALRAGHLDPHWLDTVVRSLPSP